jgi:carotenoid cleavage dioxygenase
MASVIENAIRGTVTKGIGAVAEFNRKRMSSDDGHPFLTGIHTPMSGELTLENLPVTGTIPAALDGRYLRIGPNPVKPDPKGYHWFTGDGMIHGLAIQGGKALWYRNRWIRSKAVAAALNEAAAPGPRHGVSENVNTNIIGITGRTFALVEAGSYPVEVSDTLDEQTYNPFDDTLQGSFTAHPHLDPLTGESHAICYDALEPDSVRHVVLDGEAQVIREEPIKVQHGPSIHDCAITARYALILDLPVTFSMKSMIGGHSFPYRWNPEHQARIGLLPRNGSDADVIWVDCPQTYIFHVANAFDTADGQVVLDACVYDTMFAEATGGPSGRSLGLERWTIDPVAKTVERRTIDTAPQEFPRPDERYFGQPYRYAFTMALPQGEFAIAATRLYKHDIEAGTREVHEFGEGRFPGEFVFHPRSADALEGDGWLIGLVVDLPNETTDLVILDTADFASEPTASIRIPHRVPPGFHGNWVANG